MIASTAIFRTFFYYTVYLSNAPSLWFSCLIIVYSDSLAFHHSILSLPSHQIPLITSLSNSSPFPYQTHQMSSLELADFFLFCWTMLLEKFLMTSSWPYHRPSYPCHILHHSVSFDSKGHSRFPKLRPLAVLSASLYRSISPHTFYGCYIVFCFGLFPLFFSAPFVQIPLPLPCRLNLLSYTEVYSSNWMFFEACCWRDQKKKNQIKQEKG